MGNVEIALGGVVCIFMLLPLVALLIMAWMLARLQNRLQSLEAEMRRVRDALPARSSVSTEAEEEGT